MLHVLPSYIKRSSQAIGRNLPVHLRCSGSGSVFQREERLSIPRAACEHSGKIQAGMSQVTCKMGLH